MRLTAIFVILQFFLNVLPYHLVSYRCLIFLHSTAQNIGLLRTFPILQFFFQIDKQKKEFHHIKKVIIFFSGVGLIHIRGVVI